MRWNCWITAFEEGRHIDGWCGGQRIARIVALRQIGGVPVIAQPSGRKRLLYLAMANRAGVWQAVGVFGTANKAKREAERTLREVNS